MVSQSLFVYRRNSKEIASRLIFTLDVSIGNEAEKSWKC